MKNSGSISLRVEKSRFNLQNIWKKSACIIFFANVSASVNKTGTSKVGAISEAQKAQKKFLEKNWNFWKIFFFQKKSHSAEKCKRGILLDLLTYIPLQNIKKLEGGTLWGQKKISKKQSHSAEKNSKGGPYSLVLFCILR